jgi:hypothetical protein
LIILHLNRNMQKHEIIRNLEKNGESKFFFL